MAQIRRTPRAADAVAPTPASAFLDDMRALTTAPNPDSDLLVACDYFAVLHEEMKQLWHHKPQGYLVRLREVVSEHDALGAEIARNPARTVTGRRAKAEAALLMLGEGGTFGNIARSVLREFVTASAGGLV